MCPLVVGGIGSMLSQIIIITDTIKSIHIIDSSSVNSSKTVAQYLGGQRSSWRWTSTRDFRSKNGSSAGSESGSSSEQLCHVVSELQMGEEGENREEGDLDGVW